MNFELRPGMRPMSVDKLRDSASTRSQQRGGSKAKGIFQS